MELQQEMNTRLVNIIFHVVDNSAFLFWEAVFRIYHRGGKLDFRECASAVGNDMVMHHSQTIPAKE